MTLLTAPRSNQEEHEQAGQNLAEPGKASSLTNENWGLPFNN